MRICPSCGIIAPTRRSSCSLCGTTYGPSPPEVDRTVDDSFWVRLQFDYTCYTCGQEVKIKRFDFDSSSACPICASAVLLTDAFWKEVLAMAHAVGDLAGPDPGGREGFTPPAENPYRMTGLLRPAEELIHRGFRIRMGPGNPLCDLCRGAVSVSEYGGGRLRARCGSCTIEKCYCLPDSGTALYPSLYAVLNDGFEETATVGSAVRCPGCNAPLDISTPGDTLTCRYCGTVSLTPKSVADRTIPRGTSGVWWLLFRGESPARRGVSQIGR